MIRTTGRALLIQDRHLLAVKYEEKGRTYYALPGGGQRKGEPLHRNLERECQEELGVRVRIGDLVFVREWIDDERYIHQIEFIFECTSNSRIGEIRGTTPDSGQIGVEWLPLSDILKYHIYPLEMRQHLIALMESEVKAPIYLGAGK